MRTLTFKGFITQYVKEVSDNNTISIFKLLREASTTNPKLMEPMLLYVAIKNKSHLLFSIAQKSEISKKHIDIFKNNLMGITEKDLPEKLKNLPRGYINIYNKYLEAKNKNVANDPAKQFYKDEILKIIKQHNLTISIVAKKTGLKRGNSYRYFSKDQDNYLSLDLLKGAYKILQKEYGPHKKGDLYQKQA